MTSMVMIVAKSVLIRSLTFYEYLNKGVPVQRKRRKFFDFIEQLPLNLAILHPDLFQIHIVLPLVSDLTLFIGAVFICRTICLRHNCEHAVSKVAFPLVQFSVCGNLLRETLPETFFFDELLASDLLGTFMLLLDFLACMSSRRLILLLFLCRSVGGLLLKFILQ